MVTLHIIKFHKLSPLLGSLASFKLSLFEGLPMYILTSLIDAFPLSCSTRDGANRETETFYLRDVLLCLVELLLQVAGWGLAGDFDHGQLFVVAGHVARRPTHAVTALHSRQFSFTKAWRWRGEERKFGKRWNNDGLKMMNRRGKCSFRYRVECFLTQSQTHWDIQFKCSKWAMRYLYSFAKYSVSSIFHKYFAIVLGVKFWCGDEYSAENVLDWLRPSRLCQVIFKRQQKSSLLFGKTQHRLSWCNHEM